MSGNENQESTIAANLCKNGCGFYGSTQFDGMCSVCYKENVKKKQKQDEEQIQKPASSSPHAAAAAAAVAVLSASSSSSHAGSSQSSIKDSAGASEQRQDHQLLSSRKRMSPESESGPEAAGLSVVKQPRCSTSLPVTPSSASLLLDQSSAAGVAATADTAAAADTAKGAVSSSEAAPTTQQQPPPPPPPPPAPLSEASSVATDPEPRPCSSEAGAVATAADESTAGASTKPKPPRNRCGICKKRIGLTGFECRCGGVYCAMHRYSDKHSCTFDYQSLGQEEIRKANPQVVSSKVDKL